MDEEDCVQYWLYPAVDHESDGVTTLAQVFSHVDQWLQDYVWTRDKFSLRLESLAGGQWCLTGKTWYGENVMDEWFIVSLLMEVTRIMELVARVVDTDGEIVLIQAADQLPGWAGEPDIAAGRVYLYHGEVHLIPVCGDPGSVSPVPSVTPAPAVCSTVVSRYPELTRAESRVQRVVRDKLCDMPRDTRANHHVCNVSLPRSVARLLSRDVSYLSKLVTAVNERDPLDMRKAGSMGSVKQEEMTRVSVRWSKCLYAMISSCQVTPHRSSGWTRLTDHETMLGFKLSLGAQILMTRKTRRKGAADESLTDAQQTKQFKLFKERLSNNGYFRGELEGSKKYRELESSAVKFYLESCSDEVPDDNIAEVLKQILESQDDSSDVVKSIVVGPPVDKDDSEDWLEMTPEILDKMLEAQFGVSQAKADATNNIPDEVNKFLNKVSDMAGVEHEADDIKFDADNLVNSMKKLLSEMNSEGDKKLFESDEDDSDSDVSDEGVEDTEMKEYMSKLGAELPKDDDIDKPLDIDSNVLSNLLQSYSEELGHGPVSSLFQSMKLNPGRKDPVQ